jgi:argininosuccinate lyase
MLAAIEPGMLAVDLADYLVERGLAFRQAHEVVGRAMALSERRGVSLSALPLEDLRALSPLFAEDMLEVFDVRRALARRTVPGGVGPEALRRQLEAAEASLGQAD